MKAEEALNEAWQWVLGVGWKGIEKQGVLGACRAHGSDLDWGPGP